MKHSEVQHNKSNDHHLCFFKNETVGWQVQWILTLKTKVQT
jgi:hypothetical protein